MKSYRQWIPRIGLPLIVIGLVLVYFSQIAVHIFMVHWLALGMALVMICGPWGGKRLAVDPEEKPRYGRAGWIGRIIALQLCLWALFLGVSTVCGETAPALTTPQPELFQHTLLQLGLKQGLFPWAFVALIAVAAGYYSYCQQKDAYLSTLLGRLTQRHAVLEIAINFIGRLNTLLAYAITLALIAVLWASVGSLFPLITGFSLTPVLVGIILLLLSLTKIYRRTLLKSLGKNIPLTAGMFFWTLILATAVWLLNGFLAPLTNIAMAPPGLLSHWLHLPWRQLWQIFANGWWLLWTPLIGILVARISRGYPAREIILGTLLLPLILTVVLELTQTLSWSIPPVIVTIIAALGLLGLLMITM